MVGLRAKRPHFTEKWLRFTLHFVAHFYSARNIGISGASRDRAVELRGVECHHALGQRVQVQAAACFACNLYGVQRRGKAGLTGAGLLKAIDGVFACCHDAESMDSSRLRGVATRRLALAGNVFQLRDGEQVQVCVVQFKLLRA